MRALWERRSPALGLVGSNIDLASGAWTQAHTGIGAGVDSFYEYLVKVGETTNHWRSRLPATLQSPALDRRCSRPRWTGDRRNSSACSLYE